MLLDLESKFLFLNHISILNVEGEDRHTFLQGQLTQDVSLIKKDKAQYAAFCNPKGRVLAFMLCYADHNSIKIQVSQSTVDSILKRLKMYILRSKVAINILSDDFSSIGIIGSKSLIEKNINIPKNYLEITESHHVLIMSVGKNIARYQVMGETSKIHIFINTVLDGSALLSDEEWNNEDIIDGIPTITDITQEAFIPQSLNMDFLDAINFKKGCYTGQEIVARTHYLGKVKRRMYRAFIASKETFTPGDLITNKNQEAIGQLVRSSKTNDGRTNMLIELRVDQAQELLYLKNFLVEIFIDDKDKYN